MKYWLSSFYIILSLLSFAGQPHKDTSVLATGSWYKVSIRETGIYRITYDDFKAMGFDLSQISDSSIRIFGNGGGMLPEANSASRIDDLRELSIMVKDGGDGRIDPGDYVLFYGEGPDKWTFDYSTHLYSHVKNLYSDYSYYYIGTTIEKGKRITNQPSLDTLPNFISYRFDDLAFHELDSLNFIESGRSWYGEQFDNSRKSCRFSFSFPYIDTISPLRLVTSVAARASKISGFNVSVNNKSIDSLSLDPTDILSSENYAQVKQKTTLIMKPVSPVVIDLTYSLPVTNAIGWLNFLEFNAYRDIRWVSPQMGFRNANTIGKTTISKFLLSKVTPSVRVWDVTDPGNIAQMDGILSHDTLSFITTTDTLREFYAYDGQSFDSVTLIEKVNNQDLHALSPTNLIIITHPLFIDEANRLAGFHRQNNVSVQVVTTSQVYNEFSSGNPDLTAIRDFMKMLFDRGSPNSTAPKYLLLLGDGSYDPKNRIPGNNNMIPTFESSESMNVIGSYVTDDYFGIMGDNDGQGSNGTIEIGIGRFPVTTIDQAKAIVDKIIHYAATSDTILSDWRNTMTFVADDQNLNLHMWQAEQLTQIVATKYPVYNVNKIYLDAYPLIDRKSVV